jgi:hypothetical protein
VCAIYGQAGYVDVSADYKTPAAGGASQERREERKEERGKRKEERGKRKEERGKRRNFKP